MSPGRFFGLRSGDAAEIFFSLEGEGDLILAEGLLLRPDVHKGLCQFPS